jgi:hypothetical protein
MYLPYKALLVATLTFQVIFKTVLYLDYKMTLKPLYALSRFLRS